MRLGGGGGGRWLLEGGDPSKTGELSKTNSRSVEQTLSYFTVDDLLKHELSFLAIDFITQ